VPDPIKRLNYFDHQFLHVEDFTDEQTYHREMRRLHNQLLHTWGICAGLQLSYPAGATVATVSSGTAIDGHGQQIVLTDNTNTPDISNLPGASGHQVYVTVMYAEQQSDTSSETGTTGNRRVTEAPVIEVMTQPPSDPSMHVILGRVTVGADGRLTGQPDEGAPPNIRRTAGAVGGNLEVTSLTLGSPSVDPGTWPSLRVGAPSQANLNGSLSVSGNLGVAGGVSVAGTLAVTAPSQLGRVLVGSTDMSQLTNALSVSDATGIRQNSLYLSGAPGWSSLAYNAYHAAANDQWIFPDSSQPAVTLEIDNNRGNNGRLQVFMSTLAHKTAFVERLYLDGENGNMAIGLGNGVGNLGIGTLTPEARLELVANTTTAGGWYEAIRFSQPAHSAITHPGGGLLFGLHGDRRFYFGDIAGGTYRRHLLLIDANSGNVTIPSGNLTISGVAPYAVSGQTPNVSLALPAGAVLAAQGRLHIASDDSLYLLPKNGVWVGKEWGGTGSLFVEGNLGAGTVTPGCALEVLANSLTAGGWYEAIRLSQPQHSAITHPGGGLLFGLHSDRHFYFSDIAGGAFRKHVMTIDGNTGNVAVLAGALSPNGQTATSGVVGLPGQVGVNVALPPSAVVAGQGRLHIASNELLYLLTSSGVVVGKEWGGTGNLTVEGTLSATGGVAQEDWHGVNFLNGWRNYGSGWAGAAYRKDALGVVHVRGLITGGTTGWGPNGVAFNLPPGYRPAERLMFVSICGENWGVTRCDVDAAGNVFIGQTETPGSSGNTWLTLTTIIFRADQ